VTRISPHALDNPIGHRRLSAFIGGQFHTPHQNGFVLSIRPRTDVAPSAPNSAQSAHLRHRPRTTPLSQKRPMSSKVRTTLHIHVHSRPFAALSSTPGPSETPHPHKWLRFVNPAPNQHPPSAHNSAQSALLRHPRFPKAHQLFQDPQLRTFTSTRVHLRRCFFNPRPVRGIRNFQPQPGVYPTRTSFAPPR
jgi:hypothetical protein